MYFIISIFIIIIPLDIFAAQDYSVLHNAVDSSELYLVALGVGSGLITVILACYGFTKLISLFR